VKHYQNIQLIDRGMACSQSALRPIYVVYGNITEAIL